MFPDLLFRLRALFRRNNVEAELHAELRAHLENEIAKCVAAGVPRDEAARRAVLALGGLDQIKEQCRESRGTHLLETTIQEPRYAFRMLRKNTGFTAVAIFTLAIGIGANSPAFGLVDSSLLRGLPFREPERLVHVWTTDAPGDLHTPSPAHSSPQRVRTQSFAPVAGNGCVGLMGVY